MKLELKPTWIILLILLLGFVLAGCGTGQTTCESPLDEETLKGLLISPELEVGLEPGDSLQLELAVVECCTFFQTVDACASWEIGPAEGAQISPTGLLTIAKDAPHGEQIGVTAYVENGRRIVQTTLEVYRQDFNPIAGEWEEVTRINCTSQEEFSPDQKYQEVIFNADGGFRITKQPFELYYDYQGTYTFDLATGSFSMSATRGNRVPNDLDGQGSFRVDDDGTLVLMDIWFGLAQAGEPAPTCGHRLTRR